MAIAPEEGLLGRLDQPMDMREVVRRLPVEPVEQGEDQERGDALRRRRAVMERAVARSDVQRRRPRGAMMGEVGGRDRAAQRGEVGGDVGRSAPV